MSHDTVVFKSEPRFFIKEKLGRKNNTVRETDMSETKFLRLYEMSKSHDYGFIQIKCADGRSSFKRKIKDISFWKNLCIVTWYHA